MVAGRRARLVWRITVGRFRVAVRRNRAKSARRLFVMVTWDKKEEEKFRRR